MNVHLIGNAHLDPVWLWRWQEGFMEVKATFRSALDRMEEFDDFKFTSACSAYYMWIEQSDKAMFEEIRQRVKEGRWEITGGWFIQPDCNLPSGESFARHGLISQRYFEEKFGIKAKVGYNVDSFGHNGNLPQILKKSGMDHYVFMRPMNHEKDLPAYLFDWESMDGSRVRTYRIPYVYSIREEWMDAFEKIENLADKTPMMAFYGIGNHGGGATISLLDKMHSTLSDNFVYSTTNEYFEAVKDLTVPVVQDDLQFHAKGCYSAMSEIKANNRLCENRLFETEGFSVLSNKLMDTEYPTQELERAWKNVLFNQFHDILGGCSLKDAYTDARYMHDEALSIASRNSNFALQQISWNIDTMNGKEFKPYRVTSGPNWRDTENIGTPAVLFNPLGFDVETVVEIRDMPTAVTTQDGTPVPAQLIRDTKTTGPDQFKTVFVAKIPALGYSVYRLYYEKAPDESNSPLRAADDFIENEFLRAEFDQNTGELLSILDKETGRQLLQGAASTVLMDETHCDTWAHDIREFKNCVAVCKTGSTKVIQQGPVLVTVRSTQSFENTQIIRDYTLVAGSRELQVKARIDFREKHRMLKFTLPVQAEAPRAFCEIPFGYIERPTDGSEQPCGSWIAMAEDNSGLGIATTSKYSFDAEKNVLSLTVLRGAIYADHYGQTHRDEMSEFMEQGIHEFTYTIFPFGSIAQAEKRAQMLNNPPTAIVETFHKGKLPTSYCGICVSADNIIVTAVKKHEDSDAVVLRCYETENRDTEATIRIFGREFTAKFSHNEIKTFIITDTGIRETDLLEA